MSEEVDKLIRDARKVGRGIFTVIMWIIFAPFVALIIYLVLKMI